MGAEFIQASSTSETKMLGTAPSPYQPKDTHTPLKDHRAHKLKRESRYWKKRKNSPKINRSVISRHIYEVLSMHVLYCT